MDLRVEYKLRINKVFQYIDENLDSDLSLDTISKIALFSPFHFHRIFKTITDETLNEYVTRRRIEKSVLDLMHKKIGISEISTKCGFNDSSSFTRAFKKFYGVSPTEFRKQNPNKFSKIRQLESKNGQEYPDYEKYLCVIDNLKKWFTMNAKIEIKEISKINLAYISCIGLQNIPAAYQRIMRWATPLGLMNLQTKMLTIYHDSLKVTEADKLRMDACIILHKPVKTEGEINLKSIDPGRFIIGSFEIELSEFEKSWTGLFIWMNENGYKKSDRNPFAIYHNDYSTHPENKCIVDLYIPIE